MASTNVAFVVQNKRAGLSGTNGTTVTNTPYVQAMDYTSAQALSGRVPGGTSENDASNSVTNSIVMLDQLPTPAKAGYAKNGAVLITLNGTLATTLFLANLATTVTNATASSTAGDTTFATWNRLKVFNLSGVPLNTTAADLTIAPGGTNGANLLIPANNAMTVPSASSVEWESTTGLTVNAAKSQIIITGNGGHVAVVVMGA